MTEIKPFFQTELGTLYKGDCLEVMKQLDSKSIDLVLTDPPYGIGEAKGKNKSRSLLAISKDYGVKNWDNKIPDKDVFKQIFDISKNQIIFGGNYFSAHLKNSSCWLVWDKDNGQNDFADAELIYTSFKSAVRILKFRWHGMLQEDMKNKEIRLHPTQKPSKLIELILSKYSDKNDLILDCFIGSGTTAIACENLDRKWIGIEKDPDYCEIIKNRLIENSKQLKLFSFADL